MSDRFTVGQLFPNAVTPAAPQRQKAQTGSRTAQGTDFQELLRQQMRLSHHAETRLQQRGIQLKPEQMAKIESAIDKAAAKGAKDSLVLMNDMALIVNVKNRTIVTAMDSQSMKDNVFTQIDSAIVIS